MTLRSLNLSYRHKCVGCILRLPHRNFVQFPQFRGLRKAWTRLAHAVTATTHAIAQFVRSAATRTRDRAHWTGLVLRDTYAKPAPRVYSVVIVLAILALIANSVWRTDPGAQWLAGIAYGGAIATGASYWTLRSPRSRFA